MKKSPITVVIDPLIPASIFIARRTPKIELPVANPKAIKTIKKREFVRRRAVAVGVIIKAKTKIAPTESKAPTAVTLVINIKR